MNRRVHGIGTDRAFEQLVDARGRSGGGGTRHGGVSGGIGSRLRRRELRMMVMMVMRLLMGMRMRMRVHGIMVDLIFLESVRGRHAFNAIQIHISDRFNNKKKLKKKKEKSNLERIQIPRNRERFFFFPFRLLLLLFEQTRREKEKRDGDWGLVGLGSIGFPGTKQPSFPLSLYHNGKRSCFSWLFAFLFLSLHFY